MSETQGRGSFADDARLERAAKWAHEHGGSDDDVKQGIQREIGTTATAELINEVRRKIKQLFG